MSEEPPPAEFLNAVSRWLDSEGHRGARATSVHSYGTDWAGGTESGFYSTFDVTVRMVYPDGNPGVLHVEGEAMNSLWDAVIRGYPTD